MQGRLDDQRNDNLMNRLDDRVEDCLEHRPDIRQDRPLDDCLQDSLQDHVDLLEDRLGCLDDNLEERLDDQRNDNLINRLDGSLDDLLNDRPGEPPEDHRDDRSSHGEQVSGVKQHMREVRSELRALADCMRTGQHLMVLVALSDTVSGRCRQVGRAEEDLWRRLRLLEWLGAPRLAGDQVRLSRGDVLSGDQVSWRIWFTDKTKMANLFEILDITCAEFGRQ
ncbi:unnamed protein product [Protopolystoma xenopodis]|uniref:Uncharacterized protein n=1 Tax=Protopolystoma xenopodis TaxID=117903 RepID=A0A3S5CIP4_9PLAT|nr:unnamed protein product [Protopolystoma xenopodis]